MKSSERVEVILLVSEDKLKHIEISKRVETWLYPYRLHRLNKFFQPIEYVGAEPCICPLSTVNTEPTS